MAQLPVSETRELTAAVQDYAKAIYTLESRHGAASTNELATLLEVRPASVSGMLRKLSMLRFLGERGIVPGARLELVERQPFDGPLYVRVGKNVHVLGATLARAMRVERKNGKA